MFGSNIAPYAEWIVRTYLDRTSKSARCAKSSISRRPSSRSCTMLEPSGSVAATLDALADDPDLGSDIARYESKR